MTSTRHHHKVFSMSRKIRIPFSRASTSVLTMSMHRLSTVDLSKRCPKMMRAIKLMKSPALGTTFGHRLHRISTDFASAISRSALSIIATWAFLHNAAIESERVIVTRAGSGSQVLGVVETVEVASVGAAVVEVTFGKNVVAMKIALVK